MSIFSGNDIITLFISIAIMLASAKIMGTIFNRFGLPAVTGEIIAGIILGPTLLGRLSPGIYGYFFPAPPSLPYITMEGFILIGAVFLLLVAGLEVDLSSVIRQGKSVILITVISIIIPFSLGVTATVLQPGLFGADDKLLPLAIFVGISVSITALPLIARILLNMQLFHTDFGMLIMTSAVLKDLTGWFLFSVLMQMIVTGSISGSALARIIALTVLVSVLILTLLRSLINYMLPRIQSGADWQGRIITFTIVTGLILSALTEKIGIHSIFGAFLAGIAIGDSPHLREQTRNTIAQFVDNIFAPLFFVSIGLRTDFILNFSPILPAILITIIYGGIFSSTLTASRLISMKPREAMALASGMSSTGIMGIILGIFALHNGLINEGLYEAIVLTAVFTSLLSGPLMRFFLKSDEDINLVDLIEKKLYIADLKAHSSSEAIDLMSATLRGYHGLKAEKVAELVIRREETMSTGIGNNIAIPHAKVPGLRKPCIVTARSEYGVDFDSIDGRPAHLIFMILTPPGSQQSQIQLLADISGIFSGRQTREHAMKAATYSEFMDIIKPAYKTNRGPAK